MNVLQKILKKHHEETLYILHPRDPVNENIEKMINCVDLSLGGVIYGWDSCDTFKYVAFHCKSRFCPIYDNKYYIDRTTAMSFKFVQTPHRHCAFTIHKNLRHFFFKTLLF